MDLTVKQSTVDPERWTFDQMLVLTESSSEVHSSDYEMKIIEEPTQTNLANEDIRPRIWVKAKTSSSSSIVGAAANQRGLIPNSRCLACERTGADTFLSDCGHHFHFACLSSEHPLDSMPGHLLCPSCEHINYCWEYEPDWDNMTRMP
eukprot:CAMPEP_0113947700 /NCGR_PEP_ID=MMETSP1339-20121228/66217_1 /TAXON_ID=94617 /ORGANISM="Fibrocapsa japonica" /LENGTH=147 /DNA_ID=CAMNT_0000954395 /DNA_START=120 /DNA_END=563 /DNA_ORIENTATION=- /assembly_acc=CAM_ASM_000762